MSAGLWALIFSVVGLGLGLVAYRRERQTGIRRLPRFLPYWLIPLGIMIGVLPGVLRLSDGVRLAGSVTSLIMSLTAIALLIAGRMKS